MTKIVVFSVILNGFEMLSLALRKENRVRAFENRSTQKIWNEEE
jgi:hypothetical protein